MVVNFLMFLLIVGAIYIFAYPDSQLAATTSAIGQIWSGNCHLSCRHSDCSEFSGLSGLIPENSRDTKGFLGARADYQAPSGCLCASCPCALIQNVLRTCRPATAMYSSVVQFMATMYHTLLNSLSAMYNYVESVLNCRTSCQRPQLLENKDSSSEMIYFGNKKHKDSFEKAKDKTRKSDSGRRPSKSIVFRDISDTIGNKRDEGSSKHVASSYSIDNEISNATLKPKAEAEDTTSMILEPTNSCPKCIKQGKVCIKHCPKAATKKK